MDRWRGKVALVTGASAGIGYATAAALARSGMKVIGCSRNIAKIEALSKELKEAGTEGCVVPMKCDVRNEEEIKSVFSRAKEELGGVDVCVNSAGVAFLVQPLFSQPIEEWRETCEVNIIGVMVVTREYVKQMEERKCDNGHIININSISGHVIARSTSQFAIYTATKYAMTALTEGVRIELRQKKSKIRITGISPGLTRTEFVARSRKDKDIELTKNTYYDETSTPMEPEDVASMIAYALTAPPRVDVNDIIAYHTADDLVGVYGLH